MPLSGQAPLSPWKSTAASGASGVGGTISFLLKANSAPGLKCGVCALVFVLFLKTHISVCISKQNVGHGVVGINPWEACPLLLDRKEQNQTYSRFFLNKDAQKLLL